METIYIKIKIYLHQDTEVIYISSSLFNKSYFEYRVRLGFTAAAKSVSQGPDSHAKAYDESATSRHRYQRHRHVLRGLCGGGCNLRAQCRTLYFIYLNAFFRDSVDGTDSTSIKTVVLFRFYSFQLKFRGFRMILFRRQRG